MKWNTWHSNTKLCEDTKLSDKGEYTDSYKSQDYYFDLLLHFLFSTDLKGKCIKKILSPCYWARSDKDVIRDTSSEEEEEDFTREQLLCVTEVK